MNGAYLLHFAHKDDDMKEYIVIKTDGTDNEYCEHGYRLKSKVEIPECSDTIGMPCNRYLVEEGNTI